MISQLMQSPPPPAMTPPPATAPYPTPYYPPQRTYAGFWVRLVARLIDSFIVGIPLAVLLGLIAIAAGGLAASSGNNDQNANNAAAGLISILFALFYLLAIVVSIGYWVYFWGTSGSTFGMKIGRASCRERV